MRNYEQCSDFALLWMYSHFASCCLLFYLSAKLCINVMLGLHNDVVILFALTLQLLCIVRLSAYEMQSSFRLLMPILSQLASYVFDNCLTSFLSCHLSPSIFFWISYIIHKLSFSGVSAILSRGEGDPACLLTKSGWKIRFCPMSTLSLFLVFT